MIHYGIATLLLVISAGILFAQVKDTIETVRDIQNSAYVYFNGRVRIPITPFLPHVLMTLLAGVNLLLTFNLLP